MFYSKAWQYGVRVLFELSKLAPGERRSGRELAAEAGVPAPFCGKILSALSHAGLISGRRGPGGGVMLGRSAATITLESVAVALGESASIDDCFVGYEGCSAADPCPVHGIWSVERERLRRVLLGQTLADLSGAPAKRIVTAPEPVDRVDVGSLRDELL